MSEQNKREFWLEVSHGMGSSFIARQKHFIDQCSDKIYLDNLIHVIEKSAYEALEEKLRVAVEALEKIKAWSNHGDSGFFFAKEALDKLKGGE